MTKKEITTIVEGGYPVLKTDNTRAAFSREMIRAKSFYEKIALALWLDLDIFYKSIEMLKCSQNGAKIHA